MKLEFSRRSFEQNSNITFHENPPSRRWVVLSGQTDRHDEANGRFSQFWEQTYKPTICRKNVFICYAWLSEEIAPISLYKIIPPPLLRCGSTRVMASSFLRFLDHTQRRTTVGRTPLDAWSARHRDLYLTTHNTQTDRHPCLRRDSNPQSQQASGRRPTP